MPLPWTTYLDALEEWTRRAEEAVRGGEEPVTPFSAEPDGPLPPEHAVRARALLAQMERLQVLGDRRRRQLQRARSYEQD